MDRFFDGTFLTFGIEVISFAERDQEDRIDPMVIKLCNKIRETHSEFQVYIFPRMTKCTFHKFGTSGEIEKHDAMCILPLNIGESPTLNLLFRAVFVFFSDRTNILFQSGKEIKPFLFSVNEKIYIFIWFWFLLLGFLTILILLYRILIVFSPRIRVSFYLTHIFRMFHCQLADRSILNTMTIHIQGQSQSR